MSELLTCVCIIVQLSYIAQSSSDYLPSQ